MKAINNIYRRFDILILMLTLLSDVVAQKIGIGNLPHSSAIVDVSSGNKGILFPRVFLTSNTDALTIRNPAVHLLVFNTNDGKANGLSGKGLYRNINNEANPNWQPVATNEEGLPGEQGDPGPAGNTGPVNFMKTGQIAGFLGATIPGKAIGYVFAGQTASVTITEKQKIIVWGEVPIGLAAGLPSQKVNLGAGYQLSTGGSIKNMTVNYVTVFVGPERFSHAIAGMISPGAGTWNIGAAIENIGVEPLTNNDYGNLIYMVVD